MQEDKEGRDREKDTGGETKWERKVEERQEDEVRRESGEAERDRRKVDRQRC
jgi:hypothetical protein